MIDITRAKALNTREWMLDEELVWLAERAATRERIVELGTFHGSTARVMLDNSSAHVWCIDTWDSYVTKKCTTGDEDFEIFLSGVADVIERVTVMRMTTEEASSQLPRGTFDMVFIDANHQYSSVKSDILNFAPLLEPNGLLCGHDYTEKGVWVVKAVDELVRDPRVVGTIWWSKKGLR